MKSHTYAKILPEMTGEDLQSLADNIKQTGQVEEIVLLDGDILDGRNRFAACKIAKVEPRFREFGDRKSDGKDPLAFVFALNLPRRNLSKEQRATAAAEFAAESERGRPKEVKEGEKPATTQQEAADMFNVPLADVKRAANVLKKGSPELKKAVKDGKVKLSKAASVTSKPKEKQLKAATAKAPKFKKQSPKEKMLEAANQMWIDNQKSWQSHPACTPAQMMKHFNKCIEKTL